MSETSSKSLVDRGLTYVLGTWALLAICLQTFGVLSRNVLNLSTAWVDDLQRMNFIWLIWICAGLAYGGRGLIGLDLVQSKLVARPRAYHLMTLGQSVVELLFAGVFSYLGFQMIAKQFGTGESTTVLHIPLFVLNMGFLIGCLLLLGFSIVKLLSTVRDVRLRTPVDAEETKPREA